MFNKAYKIKSHSQLKSSDRKKVRQDVIESFPKIVPVIDEIIPVKENISLMKVITHSKHLTISVYMMGKYPIYFQHENQNYPTCYLMWKFYEKTKQNLIPIFITNEQVVSRLISGADLMLPGVIGQIDTNIRSGDPVAISTIENKSIVAIGKAIKSYEELQKSQDGRGKCVEILHNYTDYLTDGLSRPQNDEVAEICTQLDNITCKEETDNVSCTEEVGEKGLTPQEEMDKLLKYSFFKCITLAENKLKLPILVSTFYKSNILEACPEDNSIDIKKSSYKKLSVFLKAMSEENIIQVKQELKGIENIVDINYNHPLIKTFVRWPNDTEQVTKTETTIKEQTPDIAELYKINAAVLKLFTPFNFKKGDELTASQVKKYLIDYVGMNSLQDEKNPSLICCDAVISAVLNCEYQEKMSLENYIKGCTSKMILKYHLTARHSQKNKSTSTGKIQPIEITVSTRSGNKKVTLVNNLELFGIVCQDFARKCQHGAAASTSVSQIPGKKSPQVLIQGNHVKYISKVLTEEYKIPINQIRGYENYTKKK